MRAYVFTDPALGKHAGQFVWLAIDGEKAVNAEFRRRYRIPAYPTYYVIDPSSGQPLLRWVGGASVSQLDRLFDEQSAAYARRSGAGDTPDAILARADSLYAANEDAGAAAAYGEALARAPAGWTAYPRAVDARMFALSSADSAEACVALAEASLANLRRTPTAASVVGTGLGCAIQLPAAAPRRAERIAALEQACKEILADTTLSLTGDDRSGLYISLLDAREEAADSLGHLRVAEHWSAFLDGEAAKAKTPDARAVFDSHRLSAYLDLGQPERAVSMLQASERDLPNDYNPSARLAVAYTSLKRWPDALAASDRAMKKVYGPRKLRVFIARADIYLGMADSTGARRTLTDAVSYAEALPAEQRSANTIASLKKRIQALPAGPAQ
jgi:hypothetical protein